MNSVETTLNAKIGAIGLLAGAGALHFVNQFDYSLVPIRLLVIGVLIMGAWAFSDEMGLRKPLNRAAFISFLFSMSALAVTTLEAGTAKVGKFNLIYAFCLLLAVLIWSSAFLHRQRDLKYIGALGATASLIPLSLIVAGHLSIGFGAYFGVSTLLDTPLGGAQLGSTPFNIIEAMFLLWSGATAIFLWKGRMSREAMI